ncbi:allene oxide synthase-lipoxygenase protein-like isoform X3 [Eriocheir sinensis]|uniref:allene oxide synthase-lipoxygenase protein-like isoform X3 n=1 Tax=Eriocheir sinensis TaxID=95602 RepID=UPI0021C89AB0|nr:allene oxide synthase-lipoxygenase protein-like isoform X3 [Eriocheir sinensis]
MARPVFSLPRSTPEVQTTAPPRNSFTRLYTRTPARTPQSRPAVLVTRLAQRRLQSTMKSPFVRRKVACQGAEPGAAEGQPDVAITVVTGDRRGAGTDSKVFLVLHDDQGRASSTLRLTNRMITNCRGQTCTFTRYSGLPDLRAVTAIELWLEKFGVGAAWFVDRVCVTVMRSECQAVFPVLRWVKPSPHHLTLTVHDCNLPQHTPERLLPQRMSDLGHKKEVYRYKQNVEGGPVQIENLPSDEKFSEEYYWTFASEKISLLAKTKLIEWTTTKWSTLESMRSVYKKSLGEPGCIDVWKTDRWFGLQRLQGVNPQVIRLCKAIPENLDVTEETVSGLLEDLTLAEALEKNKIFLCDLEITDNLKCKDDRELCSPLALFYLQKNNELMPVAIQLKQKKGPENPVYTPKDPPNTWLVAKMFYNNAEAQHHQALTHLGYTHLLMEGVVICTHRNLSPSHPLFKLMAPHFLFLLAINTRGLEKLVSLGGWVDTCMTQGVKGIFELMKRGFDRWRFDREGQVEKELEARGVLDPEILPYYPYRDDAIPLYNVIKKYVNKVVRHHYDTPEKLADDWELKWWREELVKARDNNGVGLQNVPGNDKDGFTSVEEVVDVVTAIIATCSLGHAAANFQQYEQYAFVPNYPGILMGRVPTEKKDYTERDIMTLLPDKRMTLDIMVITKLLSSRGTNSLGNFEMQYLYDPVGVEAAEEFRKDLKKLSLDMKKSNIDRQWKFDWLDPDIVPNSISV